MGRWTHVVVHHTAGSDSQELDAEKIRQWHVKGRGWLDIGYHWLVETVSGTVVVTMGRPMYMQGAHAPGYNQCAVGVALVGDFSSAPPPPPQLLETARLIAGLCSALEIPTSNILPHRDVRSTSCPGRAFPWEALLEAVEERL